MRVAEEHGGKLSRCRVQVQQLQIVQHIDVAVRDQYHFSLRQLARRTFAVGVAAHCGDRRNLAQLFEYRNVAHVAQMEDALDAFQSALDLRAEEAVGVADYTDSHEKPQESIRD